MLLSRHAEVKNELDDLSGKLKLISTKRVTKNLIDKYSIPNGGNINTFRNTFVILKILLIFLHGYLKEC